MEDFTKLEERAKGINMRGSELHQLSARTVQDQNLLLLFRFNSDIFTGLLYRHPDSTRIHHIIFVAHDECFNEASLQQPNFVSQFFPVPSPNVGSLHKPPYLSDRVPGC